MFLIKLLLKDGTSYEYENANFYLDKGFSGKESLRVSNKNTEDYFYKTDIKKLSIKTQD